MNLVSISLLLERQVVGVLVACRAGKRIGGGLGRSCGCCRGGRSESGGANRLLHACYCVGVYLTHVESADIIKPTAVPLAGVDVERHVDFLAYLYVEAEEKAGGKQTEQMAKCLYALNPEDCETPQTCYAFIAACRFPVSHNDCHDQDKSCAARGYGHH